VARTVKVGLDVDEAPYVRGVERAEKATAKLDDAVESAGGSAKETAAGMGKASESITDVGKSARGAGRELTGLRRDAAILDRQITDTARGVRDLAREISRTADAAERAKLTEKLKVERGKQRDLTDLRNLIDADEAARGFSTEFATKVGPLIARAPISVGPIGAAIALPIAAEVATVLGAAVAAGITGGAGIGGVIGGVTIAAKHSAVKAAAEGLGNEFENRLQSAAVSFVPATLSGISVIRNKLAEVEGDLESIFSNSARFVVPLAEGAGTGIQEIVAGARELVEVAGPAVDAISEGLAELGSAGRDGLESLTDNSESGARALTLVFEVVETGVRMVFGLINAFAELYEVMEFGNGLFEWFSRANDEGGSRAEEFEGSLAGLMDGFRETSTEAEDAARAVQQYAEALDLIVDQNLSAAEANLRYRDSLKEARDAVDDKRKVSRAEEEQLLSLARSSNTLTDSLEAQGASTKDLAARNREARSDFVATAMQMGYTREQARELAAQYLKVPRKVSTTVTAETEQAAANLRAIVALSAQIKSKRVVITTVNNQVVTRSEGRNVPIGSGVGGRRWGGIDYAMARGGMIEAHFATSPTVMYGERETRGEAYIPRDGDTARSRVIAQTVVEEWLGGRVAWPAGSGTGPVTAPFMGSAPVQPQQTAVSGGMTLRLVVQDGAVQGLVRVEVDEAFGALADATIYQTAE
jgi:hypothetical protein